MAFFLAPLLGALGSAGGLTAAATIAGAAINAKSVSDTNAQNKELADPVYARERLEAAGFNPAVKYGGYQPATMQPNQVGSILSQGIAAASDQLQVDGAQKAAISKLEDQNDVLTRELQKQKLNPHVGGIYARSQKSTVDVAGADPSGVRLGASSWLAPERQLKVEDYSTGSGLTEINNKLTYGPIVVPGADGEPWGIDEVVTAVAVGAPQFGYNVGKSLSDASDGYRTKKKMDRIYKSVQRYKSRPSQWGYSTPRSISPTQAEIDHFRYRRNVLAQ